MALPPSNTTDEGFIREVDEEYRRAQMLSLWDRFGRIAIGVVVAALVVFAGYLFWNNRGEATAGKQGETFDVALLNLKDGQKAKADPVLAELSKDGAPGYRAMARFTQAEALLSQSKPDTKGAAAIFASIAGDTGLPQPFRDRALLQQTLVEFDALQPQQVIDRLKPLAVDGSPWFGPAGEMVAAAYVKMGKRAEAGKLFAAIAQTKNFVPQGIRQRATQMAGVMGVDAIDQSEEKKTQ